MNSTSKLLDYTFIFHNETESFCEQSFDLTVVIIFSWLLMIFFNGYISAPLVD